MPKTSHLHLASGMLSWLLLIPLLLTLAFSCKSNSDEPVNTGETFRFVFMADSRGDSLAHPVHTEVLNSIITQIGTLSPKPSFIMFAGDMSYRGFIGTQYTFNAWKDLFAPLTSQGIVLYTTIGNHELTRPQADSGFRLVNQQAFQSAFTDNPSNGPTGYERLVYSFNSPGNTCFFAVLDPYYLTHDTIPLDLGGHINGTQISWLRSQIAQTKAVHKFLFIHTPYYYVFNEPGEPSTSDTSYTRLWAMIDSSKFDLWACGHSHLFSRRTIDPSVVPDPQTIPQTLAWKNNVVQLLNGTCGAGPDAGVINPSIKTSWNVYNDSLTYYFSVIDVAGNTVTVNSYRGYTGAYSLFDTFIVTR
jgi:hypothetical protein